MAATGRTAASSWAASRRCPYRAKVVEDALKGKDIKATVKDAAAQIRTVARPMSLNAYKVDIATLIERTVLWTGARWITVGVIGPAERGTSVSEE